MNAILLADFLLRTMNRGRGRPVFARVFTAFAGCAPLALLAYAGQAGTDAVARAQIVVAGSEVIVLALCAALVLRALVTVTMADGDVRTRAMDGGDAAPSPALAG